MLFVYRHSSLWISRCEILRPDESDAVALSRREQGELVPLDRFAPPAPTALLFLDPLVGLSMWI